MEDGKVKPFIDESELHLRRAEHLIFVSLRYTRTGDVMLNAIDRLLNSLSSLFEALLLIAKREKRIEEIPSTNIMRYKKIIELYDDKRIKKAVDLHRFLYSFKKGKIERENEYRKNIVLKGIVNNEEVEIDGNILAEYFSIVRDAVAYLKEIGKRYIEEEKEEGFDLV